MFFLSRSDRDIHVMVYSQLFSAKRTYFATEDFASTIQCPTSYPGYLLLGSEIPWYGLVT